MVYFIIGLVYIIFVIVNAYNETIENVTIHEGGFLGMGYTTHTSRELTPKDIRKGSLWPFFLLVFFAKGLVFLVNEPLKLFLLFFGFSYYKTELYKKIDSWVLK
jgi:hypothetical protein